MTCHLGQVDQIILLQKGPIGPFQSAEECKVPLWLAVQLKSLNKCHIIQPKWLNAGMKPKE